MNSENNEKYILVQVDDVAYKVTSKATTLLTNVPEETVLEFSNGSNISGRCSYDTVTNFTNETSIILPKGYTISYEYTWESRSGGGSLSVNSDVIQEFAGLSGTNTGFYKTTQDNEEVKFSMVLGCGSAEGFYSTATITVNEITDQNGNSVKFK